MGSNAVQNSSLTSPCQASSSSLKTYTNQQLHPSWEIFVSKSEGLGFYEGIRLETPTTAPSIIHPDFDYS